MFQLYVWQPNLRVYSIFKAKPSNGPRPVSLSFQDMLLVATNWLVNVFFPASQQGLSRNQRLRRPYLGWNSTPKFIFRFFPKASSQDVSDIKDGGQLQSRLPSTPPPHPHSSWALLHLGPPLLVLLSLRAWSIDQSFVQKQKLKIDRNIQFLIFFLNSRHCS